MNRRVYLLYAALPFIATIYSLVEFAMNWRGRLSRKQVLIMAPVRLLQVSTDMGHSLIVSLGVLCVEYPLLLHNLVWTILSLWTGRQALLRILSGRNGPKRLHG